MKLAYDLEEAADQVSVSTKTLRRAIATTEPDTFPPPLRAKKVGRGYRILHVDLVEWADSLPDA